MSVVRPLLMLSVFVAVTPLWGAESRARAYEVPPSSLPLLVPFPQQGTRIFTQTRGEEFKGEQIQDFESALSSAFGVKAQAQVITPKGEAERASKALLPESTLYSLNAFLPKWAEKQFNLSAGFSGPNCYSTALLSTGILPPNDLRYVSPEEFEELLQQHFKPLSPAEQRAPNDLIVYDAHRSRGHVSVYLGLDLVFHKKSYPKGYLYRITEVNSVFEGEPYEWTPRPESDFSLWNPSPSQIRDQITYRRRAPLRELPPTPREAAALRLVNVLHEAILQSAPNWKLGKALGLISERFTADLLREFEVLKTSPAHETRLARARLISLRDQIFQSIEEQYFSSPYSSGRVEKIYEEICFEENATLRSLIQATQQYLGKPSDAADVERVMNALRKQDRKKCDQISLLRIIQQP